MFEAGAPPAEHKDRINGLTAHESECGSRTETCNECGKYVMMKEMDAHVACHAFLTQPAAALPSADPIHHEPVHREETPTHEPAVCANWCGLVALSTSPAAEWAFSGSPLVSLCGQCRGKAPNTAECDNPKSWAQKLVKLYFTQLTKGCGNAWCCNPQCATGSGESQAPNTAVVQAVELAKHTGGQPPKYHMCLTEDAQQHAQRLQSMVAMGLPAGWAAHALRLKQDAVENAVLWMFEEGHNNAEPTAEPVAQPEQVIACSQCTFENPPNSSSCGMCGGAL